LAVACSSDAEEDAAPEPAHDGGDRPGDSGRTGRLFEYSSPDALGVYPIGFVVQPFVDGSRPELSTADATDNRTLPSVVWYPATESARDEAKSTYAEYFTPALQAALAMLAPAGFLDTPSDSVRDAPLAEDGPFPLIVFSHGNGGLGVQSFFLTEFLASHGYIVVCPDHTGNSLLTELPNGALVSAGGEGGPGG
jgi:hypothetical protein